MNTPITLTSKGHRLWIQGLTGRGIDRPRFTVAFMGDTVVVRFGIQGKRKVTQSKGGVVDIVSKQVTQWARGSDTATVHVDTDTQTVTFTRNT